MRPKIKFGKVLTQSGNIFMSLRYPGQVDDPEFGYYYNWHRWYDFVRGRYLSTDPMDEMGDYPYAASGPVEKIDLSGLMVGDMPIVESIGGMEIIGTVGGHTREFIEALVRSEMESLYYVECDSVWWCIDGKDNLNTGENGDNQHWDPGMDETAC